MSDFDTLQATIRRHAAERRADEESCEGCLNLLYHALRRASGPGMPLNNVNMDMVPSSERLRPAPSGSYHAAWFRLGLCEVQVRVRRVGQSYLGDYAGISFELPELSEERLLALARTLLRDVAGLYGDSERVTLN